MEVAWRAAEMARASRRRGRGVSCADRASPGQFVIAAGAGAFEQLQAGSGGAEGAGNEEDVTRLRATTLQYAIRLDSAEQGDVHSQGAGGPDEVPSHERSPVLAGGGDQTLGDLLSQSRTGQCRGARARPRHNPARLPWRRCR